MNYQIRLHNFEGPLELLLYLIKKNEVDIYDIPIALITEQYLEYIRLMQQLDLAMAGEFIVMAATLMRIKAQMLLPRPEPEEEEEEFDPRAELVEELLEYKKYKEAAQTLAQREESQRRLFPRGRFGELLEVEEDGGLEPVSLFDLLWAFRQVSQRLEHREEVQVVPVPKISVEKQMDYVLKALERNRRIRFEDLISPLTQRLLLIATFIALLELIQRRKVRVWQPQPFGTIWLFHPSEVITEEASP